MIIKHPRSRSPLLHVCSLIDQLEREVARGDKVALLYMSSLLFSNHVSCDNGQDLLSWISELASRHRERFICVARTAAPSCFRGRIMNIASQGKRELEKGGCYVASYISNRPYNPRRFMGFLNHAKFIVSYIADRRSLGTVYHSKYYGSTNITLAGLAYKRQGVGNYEEYTVYPFRFKRLSRSDSFYFSEMLQIIKGKYYLYKSEEFPLEIVRGHIKLLEFLRGWGYGIAAGTTLGELFTAYVDLLVANNMTYALLEDLPGKNLTQDLIRKLAEDSPPYDPFELEAMICDEKHADHVASLLELDKEKLRSLVMELSEKKIPESIKTLTSYAGIIEERGIEGLEPYFDEIEKSFMESLPVVETHISFLEKLRRGMQG